MYVVQQCFGLSDEGIEDALYNSQAIRRFVGIDLAREAAPDATTLLKFRRLLETHQLNESIFNTINAHLAEKGLPWRRCSRTPWCLPPGWGRCSRSGSMDGRSRSVGGGLAGPGLRHN
jgi:IS5 family transposase